MLFIINLNINTIFKKRTMIADNFVSESLLLTETKKQQIIYPKNQINYVPSWALSLKYAAENLYVNIGDDSPVFDDNDPEPRHLFTKSAIEVSGSGAPYAGVSKITVSVALANGQTYENTTTFPAIQSAGSGAPASSERPSGRVDHPDGKGSIADSNNNSGTFTRPASGSTNVRPSGSSSGSQSSGRVDHPGMTGGSSKGSSSKGSSSKGSSSSNSGSSKKGSGSTGRRR